MIVYATKLTVKKAAVGLLALAAVIWGVSALSGRDTQTVGVAVSAGVSQKLKSNEARVDFLESYGWQVDEAPVQETEVRIPDAFNAAYEDYNELQQTQGLNLEKYKGKKVMLYVYNVMNDPSGEEGVTASMVLYRDRLIAADVCSAQADGFIRPVTERPPAME